MYVVVFGAGEVSHLTGVKHPTVVSSIQETLSKREPICLSDHPHYIKINSGILGYDDIALHDYVRNTDKDVLDERLRQLKGPENEYPMFQHWLLEQYQTLFWREAHALMERVSQSGLMNL